MSTSSFSRASVMGLPIKTTVQQPMFTLTQDQLYFNQKTPEFYITTSHNAKLKVVGRLLLDLDVRVVFMGFFNSNTQLKNKSCSFSTYTNCFGDKSLCIIIFHI